MSNKATAAQAGFIAALAEQKGNEAFTEAFSQAAKMNGNMDYNPHSETITRAVRRLSKPAASRLIELLKAA